MAFETKPEVADADLYYDSSEMYNILPDVNGDLAHMGDNSAISQNQVISTNTPAIVSLPFADCYTFGNGIESFRYRDLPTPGGATTIASSLAARPPSRLRS